jgi:uncharacterized protein (TIGR02246 family)
MNDIQRLTAIEDIRAVLARRVRCLDEKDWDGFADCYAEDAISYSLSSAPEGSVKGNAAIAKGVAGHLTNVTTVHQIHTPEIDILSDDTAKVICPLADILSWEKDGRRNWMRGYGHYRQTFKKIDGRWRIAEHHLTRLLVEHGSEPLVTPDASWNEITKRGPK